MLLLYIYIYNTSALLNVTFVCIPDGRKREQPAAGEPAAAAAGDDPAAAATPAAAETATWR